MCIVHISQNSLYIILACIQGAQGLGVCPYAQAHPPPSPPGAVKVKYIVPPGRGGGGGGQRWALLLSLLPCQIFIIFRGGGGKNMVKIERRALL
jgi:hypothetical protein